MKKFIKIISISIITIIIFFTIIILSLNTINKNKAEKDYAYIQTQLLQKENENNILKNKKVYNSKIGEGTRRVIFKDDKNVEYNVYLTNGEINIEPLYYDIKKYKNPEDTKHYYNSSKE